MPADRPVGSTRKAFAQCTAEPGRRPKARRERSIVQDIYRRPRPGGRPARDDRSGCASWPCEYRAAANRRAHSSAGSAASLAVTTPIAIGNGSWDVKAALGAAKVHDDGSAFFKAPARTPLYFQALDEKGYVVQTMRSWTTLMPGEHQSCVGCHEHKNNTPRASLGTAMAMRAGPQELEAFRGRPGNFSFAREIQPILDRHCVECHTGEEEEPFSLLGKTVTLATMKRKLSQSYLALTHTQGTNGDHSHPMVNWIDCMSGPQMLPPYSKGAATSKLMTLLEDGHEDVTLTRDEIQKIACWIDLLVPYCGDYTESNTWSKQEQDFYAHFAAGDRHLLPERPEGCFAQKVPVTFLSDPEPAGHALLHRERRPRFGAALVRGLSVSQQLQAPGPGPLVPGGLGGIRPARHAGENRR